MKHILYIPTGLPFLFYEEPFIDSSFNENRLVEPSTCSSGGLCWSAEQFAKSRKISLHEVVMCILNKEYSQDSYDYCGIKKIDVLTKDEFEIIEI